MKGNGTVTADKPMLVLVFDENGTGQYKEMTRSDLLAAAKEFGSSPEQEQQSGAKGDTPDVLKADIPSTVSLSLGRRRSIRDGSPTQFSKRRLRSYTQPTVRALHRPIVARDLRKMNDAFSVANEVGIIIRKNAILVNADPIRGILFRGTCYILIPDGADSIISILQSQFKQCEDPSMPFELRALDAILSTLCKMLGSAFDRLEPKINQTLRSMEKSQNSSHELESLRKFKNSVNEIDQQTQGLKRAIVDLLDNEEDLQMMQLTKIGSGDAAGLTDYEEAEMLLETYLQDVHSMTSKIELLRSNIDNTESIVMLKLDSVRNYLLTADMILALTSCTLAIGMMITGVFGMNISSGWEDRKDVFVGVCITIGVTMVLSMTGSITWLSKRGLIVM